MMKVKKIWSDLQNRYEFKIGIIAFISVLLGLTLNVIFSYNSIQSLYRESSQQIENGLSYTTKDYMNSYINIAEEMVQTKISSILDEQAILADIYQKVLDNKKEFGPVIKQFEKTSFFKDNLSFNGRWYQNRNNEPSTLLVQRYLLNDKDQIKSEVVTQIQESAFLDLITPSFYKYGAKKLWVYFQGGRDASFLRITPWNDAGTELDKVYPLHTDKENWEAFNPGLVDAWEKKIKDNPILKNELSKLAIIKSPTQDGGTGKIIMTLDHPIWSEDRTTFKGAVCMDVELDEIVNYIQNVKIAKTGFAFISQSNGNIFAVSKEGAHTLGIKSVDEATIKSGQGIGFNDMKRFFTDSKYDSIQKIKLPDNSQILTTTINIDGKEYMLIQKNLQPLQTWNKEKGFYLETWTLGSIVPTEEVYNAYFAAKGNINDFRNKIVIEQVIIAFLTILFITIGIRITVGKLTGNLRKLEFAAFEIMKKNYDVNIDINSKDEIGRLGTTLNNMISEIKSTFEKLNIQNVKLTNVIEEKCKKDKQIQYLTEYDTLTNLPKQNLLASIIEEKMYFGESIKNLVIVILGIDNFRNVNEVFGNSGGNELLRAIANRLKSIVMDDGVVSRVDGNEFAIALLNISNLEEAAQKVEGIMNSVKQSYKINDKELFITSCAGISSYPTDGKNAVDLIQFASSALVHAKKKGHGSYQFYDVETNKNAEKRISMITALRHALENDELELYYQPCYNLKSKNCVGLEALIRWNSPSLGRVMPNTFIPLAEETGIINSIGEWVLRTATMQGKKWHDMGYRNLSVAVNLSPIQFKLDDLVASIFSILEETKFPTNFLELEVTESLFINDMNDAIRKLRELREQGIRIAVDDFGTGYSSLSYIKNLPIDKLKIDRAFIKDIPDNDEGIIADIIISLARNLNMRVIAEGVETKEQEKFLLEKMCHEVQGYFYSVPLPVKEITHKLSEIYN